MGSGMCSGARNFMRSSVLLFLSFGCPGFAMASDLASSGVLAANGHEYMLAPVQHKLAHVHNGSDM
eukprot:731751-Pelagomonas_calceolata.AAC.1